MPQRSPELLAAIKEDLIAAYQAKFGDAWIANLQRNLVPSPITQIAAGRGVPVYVVREIKHQLWVVGMLLNSMTTAAAATAAP